MKKGNLLLLIVVIIGMVVGGVWVGNYYLKSKLVGSDDVVDIPGSSGGSGVGRSEIPDDLYCDSDADCVPATCCHASACVARGRAGAAPDCSAVFCTQECAPRTLDCGQGSCGCVNNKCTAEIG